MNNYRRKMGLFDWLNAAALLAVGLYLGFAIEQLFQLDGVAFWVVGLGGAILFAGILTLDRMVDRIFERFFPSGIKPADNPEPLGRKPIFILFSLPVGLIIGFVGAQFGLGELLL